MAIYSERDRTFVLYSILNETNTLKVAKEQIIQKMNYLLLILVFIT